MFGIKTNSLTGETEMVLVSVEDIVSIFSLISSKRSQDKYLNASTSDLAGLYHQETQWLYLTNGKKTPYLIIHDYRAFPLEDWGNYHHVGKFDFPNELDKVKELAVDEFKQNNLLYKGDNNCPRVLDFDNSNNELTISIQSAKYFDQVGTNLILDYKGINYVEDKLDSLDLRHWDIKQSKTNKGFLPAMCASKLANTIGVAIGISAVNRKNEKVFLTRKRSNSVSVYRNEISVPFSFALTVDFNEIVKRPQATIYDLIKVDLKHEQAEELGLEPWQIDLENIRPLLFCRDLLRGGKPQFFFEVKAKVSFEELVESINKRATDPEFKGKVKSITYRDAVDLDSGVSPELLAFVASAL